MAQRPLLNHWMRVEPLNRTAWPDYPLEAERYGRLAAVTIAFYLRTDNPAEADAAYVYARAAARMGNIALCAQMDLADILVWERAQAVQS